MLQDGIAHATKPYSRRNANGTYTFTKFKQNIVFGPGSKQDTGLYFCKRCDNIWFCYGRDDPTDERYKTFIYESSDDDGSDRSDVEDDADDSDDGSKEDVNSDQEEDENDEKTETDEDDSKKCVYCNSKKIYLAIRCFGCG